MKNIVILGPPRVGKSSLASLLCKKFALSYISGDSIRDGFMKIFPELGFNTHNTIENTDFCKFINFLINENNICLKRDIYYVIETCDISIENALEYFNDCFIIVIGEKDIIPEKLASNIKKNDTKLDWTDSYSDKDLLGLARWIINRSKALYEQSKKDNILYFDTSLNREKAYKEIIEVIEREMGIKASE